ncbi:hypothetical protein V5799_007580 [Amblyomma americanum]|uniref:Cytochrome n=1 Tax=Amblyomma americanum TaxID=6943 RepID=A0AAQ4FGH2_AMBAM
MALFPFVADWVVLAVTAVALLYLYATKNSNYWKKQNVKYEKLSLTRPLYRLLTKPICIADQEKCQKYGRLFGFFEGTKPALMVAEPELVKQVLVKDFSLLPNRLEMDFGDPIVNNMMVFSRVERWRKIRPAASPSFTTGKLRKMHHLIQECVRITSAHLDTAADNEKNMDMKTFYSHYTVDVIARCAFGTRLDSQADTTHQFVKESQKAFASKLTPSQLLSLLFPGLTKTLGITVKTAYQYTYFRELFQRIMTERKEKNERIEDFLQLMIEAKEGHFATPATNSADAESKLFDMGSEAKPEAKTLSKALTEDEALAQCLVFFLAGQDTSSSTLAGAVYYLALNPDAQERLREEADECFNTHGPEPSLDVVSKLKYLHCVVSETLRLLPAVPRTQRIAAEEYVLGDTGIKLPKKSTVVIPIYGMHHDPEVFHDPERFDPDRFSDENINSVRPYTYIPFGAGPRNCIGMRLALQSVKLCLLHSVHRVQFVRTAETKVPLEIKQGLGSLRIAGATVGIRKRSRAPA